MSWDATKASSRTLMDINAESYIFRTKCKVEIFVFLFFFLKEQMISIQYALTEDLREVFLKEKLAGFLWWHRGR